MREATARGPSIDISEFERRLRGVQPQEEKPAADPLAELARLLHGDEAGRPADPYGHVFAEPSRSGPAQQQRQIEGAFERGAFSPGELRGSLPPQPAPEPHQQQAYRPPSEPAVEADWPHHDQDYLDYGVEGEEELYNEEPAPKGFFAKLRSGLRPWHAVAGVTAVGLVSVGLAFTHRGSGGPREIADIHAPEGPAKIQPQTVAEAAAPQRGAAILDRTQSAPVKKIVSNQEQPIDPAAAVRVVKLGGDGPVDAPHEPAPKAASPYVSEPKKVKTVSVRPDGTVIDRDAPAPALARPSMVAPNRNVPLGDARAAAAAPTATPKSPAKPATTPTAAAQPAPRPKPLEKPPVQKPTAEQTAALETPAGDAAAGTGAFAVQFGAAGSEDEARKMIQTVSSKFGGQLGGRRPGFRLAKVGEKSVYRVRVAGMSREQAVGVCEKVKAAGGNCFVAGN
jgi:hypothetical protein